MNKEEMEDPKWEALGQVIGDYLKVETEKPSYRHIKSEYLQCLTMNKEEMEKPLDPKWKALGQVIGDYVKEEIETPSYRHITLKFLQCLTNYFKAVNRKDENMVKMIKGKLINYCNQIDLIKSGKFKKDKK